MKAVFFGFIRPMMITLLFWQLEIVENAEIANQVGGVL